MAVVFFDTSALIRRYDRAEPGSARVRALCRASAGNALLIARVTPVEVAAAAQRKVREGRLDSEGSRRFWRLFRLHLRHQYRVIALDEEVYRSAELLLTGHPLRAFDALQVATALRAAQMLAGLTADFRFCTADRQQATAARGERLRVELVS